MPLDQRAENAPPQLLDVGQPQAMKPSAWLPLVVITLAAMVSVFVLRAGIASGLRAIAAERLDQGSLSSGHGWLLRAERLSPSPHGQLLRARIRRLAGEREQWDAVISGVDASIAGARLERRLGRIRWGLEGAIAADELSRLVGQGASRDEAAASLALGLLESGNPIAAAEVLQTWQETAEHPAQRDWLSGVLEQHMHLYDAARTRFEMALENQPDHDNARLGLAEVLEQLHHPDAAAQFALAWERFPDSEQALLGVVRCARRSGRVAEAAALIKPAITGPDPSVAVWLEAAEVAFFAGDYDEAAERFRRADLAGPHLAVTIRTAATVHALAGEPVRAQELFNRYLAAHSLTNRQQVLEARVREDPSDSAAAEELRTILAGEYEPLAAQPRPCGTVSPLFSRHCAACHGEGGLGDGPANRHLYPPSRNLRDEPYRLVTTVNRFPSPDDIRRVIRRGIPGTAMRGFVELTDTEIERLADDVYRLRQAGFRSDVIERHRRIGEDMEEEELAELVEERGTAGEAIDVPDWPPGAAERLAAGRFLFQHAGCNRCHGDDGRGQSPLLLLDDQGRPTAARDLVHDPLKGGEDRDAVYARLRLGMPGTPHPAHPALGAAQLTTLVEYCLSLAHQPRRASTGYQRAGRVQQQATRAVRAHGREAEMDPGIPDR